MKDLSYYIGKQNENTTYGVAYIYYIERVYIFENGESEYCGADDKFSEFYDSYEHAMESKEFYEHQTIPQGIKEIKYDVKSKLIQIKL